MTDRPMQECIDVLREALDSEDFQPQFSSRQHMTGPALRGTIERALLAAQKAATNPARPTMRECLERAYREEMVWNDEQIERNREFIMNGPKGRLPGAAILQRALEIACGEESDDA